MKCRFDGTEMSAVFVDLGFSPPSNSYLRAEQLMEPEIHYPLKLYVNERTFYVQIEEVKKASEIFSSDYAYFSSFSSSWLEHAKKYVDMISSRLNLTNESFVVEIASNDGYLLKNFLPKQIPMLGVEPSMSVAAASRELKIPTITEFFTESLAKNLAADGKKADLIIGNNVFAHVPDVNDFVGGLKQLLKPTGTVTLEFPHLLRLIEENQYDTIYHEHYSYFSLHTSQVIFKAHGLEIYDVDQLRTHGGSLRVYLRHSGNSDLQISSNVLSVLDAEKAAGLVSLDRYIEFGEKVKAHKLHFLNKIIGLKERGCSIAAYGAAAKGNTLLNYAGVGSDLIDFVVDRSPHKQGLFMPGSHIPIVDEGRLKSEKPDYVLILPWNLKEEITSQLSYIREWGGRFIIPIPNIEIC